MKNLKIVSVRRRKLWAVTTWAVALRLLRPWDFPGKSTGVGCHFLLQGIFPTQGSNLGLLHCRQTLYPLSHQGSPENSLWKAVENCPMISCRILYWKCDLRIINIHIIIIYINPKGNQPWIFIGRTDAEAEAPIL